MTKVGIINGFFYYKGSKRNLIIKTASNVNIATLRRRLQYITLSKDSAYRAIRLLDLENEYKGTVRFELE